MAIKLPANYSYSGPFQSQRKNKRMYIILHNKKTGKDKHIHFGHPDYTTYYDHHNAEKRRRFRARAEGIRDKHGKLAYKNIHSPLFWSYNILW